jgi:hypothetical protein
VWPVPLIPRRLTTNLTSEASFPGSTGLTNWPTMAPTPSSLETNKVSTPSSLDTSVSSLVTPLPTPNVADGNPLPASNLLVVTPQMLADYFKATLSGMDKLSTNAPAGPEILFNPPTPKPPSSEAIYRNQ